MTRPIDLEKLYLQATELQQFHTNEVSRLKTVRGEALRELHRFYTLDEMIEKYKLCKSRIQQLIYDAKNKNKEVKNGGSTSDS